MEEKRIIKKFMGEVHAGKGLGIYGIIDVIKSLKNGIVDTVIVTDDIDYVKIEVKCKRCGTVQEKFVERPNVTTMKQEIISRPCPSCNAIDFETYEKDIVDYFEELVTLSGSKLEVISGKTEEGAQLGSIGKVGAILRFRPVANA
jgi:peptide chain release factor subunit 1